MNREEKNRADITMNLVGKENGERIFHLSLWRHERHNDLLQGCPGVVNGEDRPGKKEIEEYFSLCWCISFCQGLSSNQSAQLGLFQPPERIMQRERLEIFTE